MPTGEVLTFFHSKFLPSASLVALAASIVRAQVAVDATTVAVAAALMIRFEKTQPISAHMMHRLFVACVLIAAKVHQDKFPCNQLLGTAVGIGLVEMNRLECAMTTALDWRFVVTQQDLLEAMTTLAPRDGSSGKASSSAPSFTSGSVLRRCSSFDSFSSDEEWTSRVATASASSSPPRRWTGP